MMTPIAQSSAAIIERAAPPKPAPGTLFASGNSSIGHLRASEERYRNLIYHLPVGLLQVDVSRLEDVFGTLRASGVIDLAAYVDQYPEMVDLANKIVHVAGANQEAVSLFGGAAPVDLIRPFGFLFAISRETTRRVMIAHFDGKRSYAEATRIRAFDGRVRDVRLSATFPVQPEQPGITLICLEDITERLRTERQLRQLQTDFTHAARISMLGELTTSIAHEVNQPLAPIVTNAETSLRWLAQDDPNLAKVGQLATRIVASAQRASDIVQRIREMAARNEPERTALDLNEIVDEAFLFIRHDIEARSIDVAVNRGTEPLRVVGDRIQLQQVIINLLINSVQAIAQDNRPPRIDIETSRDEDGTVTFTIHDSGPGIADKDLDRIFDSFFTTKDSGMGIGLAICQSIIVAHGGCISASNHPDGGAEFSFCLPALAAVHGIKDRD